MTHEATARAMKAEAIADTLYELARRGNALAECVRTAAESNTGVAYTEVQPMLTITPELIDKLSSAFREQIVATAMQRPASDATWRVVRSIVERRGLCWPHAYDAHGTCTRCGDDPFSRIDAAVDRNDAER